MRRFFIEPENIDGKIAYISKDAAHITRVLRMDVGDEVLLFDGTGYEYIARLTAIDSKECIAEIQESKFSEQEPQCEVIIFQGIPKSGKMESIIQKSVELGVAKIFPTVLDRCVAKLEKGKKEAEKLKRWNKVAVEAAKQCGRGRVPEVMPSVTIDEAIKLMLETDLAIMPYEMLGHEGDRSLKKVLQEKEFKTISVLIGPEGGFSDKEAEKAREAGIKLVGLGKRILRTETVASTILSVIMYENNEM